MYPPWAKSWGPRLRGPHGALGYHWQEEKGRKDDSRQSPGGDWKNSLLAGASRTEGQLKSLRWDRRERRGLCAWWQGSLLAWRLWTLCKALRGAPMAAFQKGSSFFKKSSSDYRMWGRAGGRLCRRPGPEQALGQREREQPQPQMVVQMTVTVRRKLGTSS